MNGHPYDVLALEKENECAKKCELNWKEIYNITDSTRTNEENDISDNKQYYVLKVHKLAH